MTIGCCIICHGGSHVVPSALAQYAHGHTCPLLLFSSCVWQEGTFFVSKEIFLIFYKLVDLFGTIEYLGFNQIREIIGSESAVV